MKRIITAICIALMLLCGAVSIGLSTGNVQTAQAATSTSAKYKTNGSYNTGGAETSGCPSNFTIYMHSSVQNGTGTISNGRVLNWTYTYIKIEVATLSNHVSFRLTRNGITHTSKSLSGNANLTLYSGSLSDGEYELTYVGNYKKNIFTGTTTYTYKYRFVIDRTGPTYTLKAGGNTISSGTYTNKQIVYSVTDYKTWCIYYRKPGNMSYNLSITDIYTISATDANNGWWYLYAEDYYYNTNVTVSVYLDTVKPVGNVRNSSGTAIANGGYTNKAICYTATDTGGVKTYEYKTPSSSSWQTYTSGTYVSGSNGWYTFRATDKASNVSDEYRVYYDASTPSGTLYGGTTSKTSGSYTNAEYVRYVASNSYSGIANCYVKMPNTSYYTSYTSGSQLTAEGTYSFYCTSRAGTSSATVTITLDKTKPVGTLYGGTNIVANNGYTNAAYVRFLATDRTAMSAYVKKPGSSAYVSYSLGAQFTEEGTYSFYVTDAASNRSDTYTITLSHEIPEAQLYADGEPFANNGYTDGGHIRFECDESCYVMLPGESAYIPYASGTEFYKPGKYVFYGISPANNHSGYYTIVIDRTEKPLTLKNAKDGKTYGDVVIEWTDGDSDVYAPVKTVTINGSPYEKGEVVHTVDTGVYTVKCEDAAGNVWGTEFISEKRNVLTQTLQKEYYEAYDGRGDYYAFASYDSAFAFAAGREESYVRTGEWNNELWDTGIAMDLKDSVNAANGTYYIYKKSGSPEEEVAYFTRARLDEVIGEYAAEGIRSYYYWEKTPGTVNGSENLYGYSDERRILADSVMLGANTGYLIDGEPFTGTVFEGEGRHTLTAFDEWGNACEYELIVVRRAPEIFYTVGSGAANAVTFDRSYFFKDAVTVGINDEYDAFAMFDVYAEDGSLLARLSLGQQFTLDGSGRYTVRSVNHFGYSEEFALFISLDAPEIGFAANEAEKRLEITVTLSEDAYSHLQTLEIYKSFDNGETWCLVEKDDYGKPVSLDNLSYAFRTSGLYKAVVTDEFRTGIDAVIKEFSYAQPAPEGILSGVDNGGYTNRAVTFGWTDEAAVRLEKDGEELFYESGQLLTEDGSYTLTFENFDGYKVVYTFVIDTAAPEISVSGAEDGETVNTDVSVSWTEQDLTAELHLNGEFAGTYENGAVLTDDGTYRIAVKDFAGNITEIEFTIDKTAEFAIDVNDKRLANAVTVTANEPLRASLTKDGEAVEFAFGETIAAPGKYTLTLTDELGNVEEVSFTIVKPLVRIFEHNFDDMPGFEKVTVNGADTRLNYGTLELMSDGAYEVAVYADGKAYIFTVTVDNTAPGIVLTGVENGGKTKGSVTLSELSEEAAMTVYLNDTEIAYTLGEELNEVGRYRVVLTDACGNTSEYAFEILYSMNGGAIALIVIGLLLLAGGGAAVILMRRKGKFSRENKKKEKAE